MALLLSAAIGISAAEDDCAPYKPQYTGGTLGGEPYGLSSCSPITFFINGSIACVEPQVSWELLPSPSANGCVLRGAGFSATLSADDSPCVPGPVAVKATVISRCSIEPHTSWTNVLEFGAERQCPDLAEACASCPSDADGIRTLGAAVPDNKGGPLFQLGLGRNTPTMDAGFLLLHVKTPSSAMYTPAALSVP